MKTGAQLNWKPPTATIAVPADAGETYRAEVQTPAGPTHVQIAVAMRPTPSPKPGQKLTAPAQLTGTFAELDAASQMPLAKFQIDAVKGDARPA